MANRGLGGTAVFAVSRLAAGHLCCTAIIGTYGPTVFAASPRSHTAVDHLPFLFLPHHLAITAVDVGNDVNALRALSQLLAENGKRPALYVLAAFLAVQELFLNRHAAATTSSSHCLHAAQSAQAALAICAVALHSLPSLAGFPHRHQLPSNAHAVASTALPVSSTALSAANAALARISLLPAAHNTAMLLPSASAHTPNGPL